MTTLPRLLRYLLAALAGLAGSVPAADLSEEMARALHTHHIDAPTLNEARLGLRLGRDAYLRSLDPYTAYLPPDDATASAEPRHGIGADIFTGHQPPFIVPYLDGPAWRAGLTEPGRLLEVAGQAVSDLSRSALAAAFRRPIGETVTITVRRAGRTLSETLRIRIDEFRTRRVEPITDVPEPYLRLRGFRSRETAAALRRALLRMPSNNSMPIIDLRFAQGGDFFEALDTASLLLPEGSLIALTEDRDGTLQRYHALAGARIVHAPALLLVGPDTASAAEVLAAALRHHGAAVLVGRPTHGKCTSQTLIPLSDGGTLRITNLRLLWPSGEYCAGRGLQPDILVSETELLDTMTLIRQGTVTVTARATTGAVAPARTARWRPRPSVWQPDHTAMHETGDHPVFGTFSRRSPP